MGKWTAPLSTGIGMVVVTVKWWGGVGVNPMYNVFNFD